MPTRKTTKQFIKEATHIHDNKYDYSLVEYKNTHTKINIVCSTHGTFKQDPKSHLRGSGCPMCYHMQTSIRLQYTNSTFIDKAKKKHKGKYDYTMVKYIDAHTNVKILCPTHGEFIQAAGCHLYGQGCPKCARGISGRRLTKEQFIKRGIGVHGEKFDYSLVDYKNGSTPVTILCPTHGSFNQKPYYHLDNKVSCPKCVLDQKTKGNRFGGYNENHFNQYPEMKHLNSTLYIVEFSDRYEKFIKIGITTQKLKYRFPKFHTKGYKVKTIHTVTLPLYEAFKQEQQYIKTLKQFSYKPTRKFNGWSECFNETILEKLP